MTPTGPSNPACGVMTWPISPSIPLAQKIGNLSHFTLSADRALNTIEMLNEPIEEAGAAKL
jgi:hypothetical protein